MPNSSTCCRLDTDHKDVALVTEFKPHLHTPKNLLKQIQRCFSWSFNVCFSAFLMSQYFAFTSLSSFLQHLGGCSDLVASSVQQLTQKLDVSSFLSLGENICRHRCAFDPLEPRLVAEQALLIMLSSIPRRLSSDVLLAAEPAARRASASLLQSSTHRASAIWRYVSYSARPHKSPQISPHSSRNISVCSRPVENAAHSAPRRTPHNSSYLTRAPGQH